MSDESDGGPDDRKLRLKGTRRIEPYTYGLMSYTTIKLKNSRNYYLTDEYNLHISRSNDLYGQLEDDDVSRNTSDARFEFINNYRSLH